MALTTDERALFIVEQLAQLDRFSDIEGARFYEGIDRARRLRKWVRRTPEELRAIVNVAEVQWGRGDIMILPSVDNDYTPDELQGVTDDLRGGDDWVEVAAATVAAGGSVKQRLLRLEG